MAWFPVYNWGSAWSYLNCCSFSHSLHETSRLSHHESWSMIERIQLMCSCPVLTSKILFSQPHSNRCRPISSRHLKWFQAKFLYMWWTFCNLLLSWIDICDKVGVIMVSVAVATDTEVRTVLQVPHIVSLGLLVFHSISLGFQVFHSVSLGILGFQSIPHSFIAFHGSSPGL